jgi:hypothetical protein
MADLLGQSGDWLEAQRHTHLTRPVEYGRGGESLSLQASVGSSQFDEVDTRGILVRVISRDYFINAEDLTIGQPKAGDRIEDEGIVYEVNSFGGEPAWRFSDPNRRTYRVHTKEVGQS